MSSSTQELMLTDIKHVFSQNPLRPIYRKRRTARANPTQPMRWLRFEEGIYCIGNQGSGFRYDNEEPFHRVFTNSADYTGSFQLPHRDTSTQKTVAFFPGSTIGNFEPFEALWFLQRVASLCGRNGGLLVGVDLKKDRHILETAYNDHKGVTASFNLNLLARANRELGTDFDLSSFRHQAIYDEALGRIEMRLISLQPQIVRLGNREFFFGEDEYITTEYSYKYSLVEFSELAQRAGFEVLNIWIDANKWFSVQYLGVRSASNSDQKKGERETYGS